MTYKEKFKIMAKVRTKKEHKKRVAKRNNILNQQRKQFEKAHKNLIMKMIEDEKNRGMFDGNVTNIQGDVSTNDPIMVNDQTLGLASGPRI